MIVDYSKKHKKGQLVCFDPAVKKLKGIPFVTCSWDRGERYWAYEKIDMISFPSWNDFSGYKVSIPRGAHCIVLQDLGMPEGLLFYGVENPSIDMHIYSVLVQGFAVQIFGCDLRNPLCSHTPTKQ